MEVRGCGRGGRVGRAWAGGEGGGHLSCFPVKLRQPTDGIAQISGHASSQRSEARSQPQRPAGGGGRSKKRVLGWHLLIGPLAGQPE